MREEPRFAMLYRKFKQPFFGSELDRQPGELSIVFLVDENPNVASAGLRRLLGVWRR
jgi:hypothetical protein